MIAREGNDLAVADDGRMREVAPQAKIGVAIKEHLGVHRAMWVMAYRATFTHRFVFENERAFLGRVAPCAGFVLILQACALTHDGIALVHIVAIHAAHVSGEHGMGMRQVKLAALVEVALKTGFGRFLRVDNSAGGTAGIDVLAAWTVAAFATETLGVFALDHDLGVGGAAKVLGDVLVALDAGLGTDVFCVCDPRRRDDRAVNGDTSDQHDGPQGGASEDQGGFGATRAKLHGKNY